MPCRSCWPSRKLRDIYPDVDALTRADSRITSGDLLDILHRCHAIGGLVWWARQVEKKQGHKLFIPGGRCYANEAIKVGNDNDDDSDNDTEYVFEKMEENKRSGLKVSSTRIRELIFYSTTSEDTLEAELATLAAKSELLALYMGMDDYSKPCDVVIQGSMPTQI